MSPSRRRQCIDHVRDLLGISERRACQVLGRWLTDLFILRGPPAFIRSDNGPEFVAEAVQRWIAAVGTRIAFIKPGSPWGNGYIESFNARLREELLDGDIFYSLKAAQVVIEQWRRHYHTIPPAQQPGIAAAGSGSGRPAKRAVRLRSATPTIQLGGKPTHALTFNLDQSPGADH